MTDKVAELVKKDLKTKKQVSNAEKRLKTMEDSIKKLLEMYAELDAAHTQHICTPDAHNPYMLSKKRSK